MFSLLKRLIPKMRFDYHSIGQRTENEPASSVGSVTKSDRRYQAWLRGLPMLLVCCIAFPSSVSAHFIWIVKSETGYQVYFSEVPHPESASLLKPLTSVSLTQPGSSSKLQLKLVEDSESGNGWLACDQADQNLPAMLAHNYGVLTRNEEQFLLQYFAEYFAADKHASTQPDPQREFQMTVSNRNDQWVIGVYRFGQPVADCGVTIRLDDGEGGVQTTDSKGEVWLSQGAQRISARARFIVNREGEHQGQTYQEVRQYLTLVVDNAIGRTETVAPRLSSVDSVVAKLPLGLTSFGAIHCRDHIFIFGGHTGEAHDYAENLQSGVLYGFSLAEPASWTKFAEDQGVQGNALVAHQDQLYRLGGMRAVNREGEEHRLTSVDDFDRFDFESRTWVALQPLPEPRSSFDALVVQNKIYVVGGWILSQDADPVWCDTAWEFDLSDAEASWKQLPVPPFKTRAVALGEIEGKLYVVGGMDSNNRPTRKVHIYCPSEKIWSQGPTLPEGGYMEGFGSACLSLDGSLIASTYEGKIYVLSPTATEWDEVGKLPVGRFFHRLVRLGSREFAVIGGANMEIGKPQEALHFILN